LQSGRYCSFRRFAFARARSLAEAEFTTSGNTADIAFPGFDMEVVMKSGRDFQSPLNAARYHADA
jgi:hypothetical protein